MLSRGVDNYYESPATEPELQGCTKDHAVEAIQIWNIGRRYARPYPEGFARAPTQATRSPLLSPKVGTKH